MRTKLYAGAAIAALMIPGAAFAQSTGSIEFENEIVVTGSSTDDGVAGVRLPDSPKAKVELQRELLLRQRPGQSVNDIVNLVPGVNFTNNDPWGSGGGSFTIRGFGGDRISQTVDGIPLNDSGNYALYTNQQQDPETLSSVNVNLGSTDVDSPTAAASGGTVNIRTRVPSETFGVYAVATYGDILSPGSGQRPYFRVFGMIDTGDITGIGTRAWVSASRVRYENPFNNYGQNLKAQFNGRIYQEIGSNGDFVSISGHYNQNENNFFGSLPLRIDRTISPTNLTVRNVGPNGVNRYPTTGRERFYAINTPCNIDVPQAGVADVIAPQVNGATCGGEFDRRYNPSQTGNVRGSSRFTLTDGLILTVDPSYQYVKANGGGTTNAQEPGLLRGGQPTYGFVSNTPYFGVDLNGDGDVLDQVLMLSPSQTTTRRWGVIASLSWEISSDHRVRLAYTFDRARHRQTGEVIGLFPNGEPIDFYAVNNPVRTVLGMPAQRRNRLSYATLNQVSAEYRGRFFDDALVVNLGLRAPFFRRSLNQYCYTTSASGFVDCVQNNQANYEAAIATEQRPVGRTYTYNRVLPSVGLTWNASNAVSVNFNWTRGLQVPGTDPLYNSLFFANAATARPTPETTDSFDLTARYTTSTLQASATFWYTIYDNRLATAYDPVINETVYRNLGRVTKYGIDASLSWRPIPEISAYVFASALRSEIRDNVQIGAAGTFYRTAGAQESGSPQFILGGRVQGNLGPVEAGIQAKHTSGRFINDENQPVFQCTAALVNGFCAVGGYQVFGAKSPSYVLVDLDIRYSLADLGLPGSSIQFNVTNLLDKLYIGNTSNPNRYSLPFVQIGAPRAASISLIVAM